MSFHLLRYVSYFLLTSVAELYLGVLGFRSHRFQGGPDGRSNSVPHVASGHTFLSSNGDVLGRPGAQGGHPSAALNYLTKKYYLFHILANFSVTTIMISASIKKKIYIYMLLLLESAL